MNPSQLEVMRVQVKLTYLGLFLNVLVPIAVIIVLMLTFGGQSAGGFSFGGRPDLQVIFLVFLLVSLGDFAALYYLRRTLPRSLADGRLMGGPGGISGSSTIPQQAGGYEESPQQAVGYKVSPQEASGHKAIGFEALAMRITLIICVINLCCTLYGIVLVLLGAPPEAGMLLVALTLVGYQIFKPRQKYLEQLRQMTEGTPPEG